MIPTIIPPEATWAPPNTSNPMEHTMYMLISSSSEGNMGAPKVNLEPEGLHQAIPPSARPLRGLILGGCFERQTN